MGSMGQQSWTIMIRHVVKQANSESVSVTLQLIVCYTQNYELFVYVSII